METDGKLPLPMTPEDFNRKVLTPALGMLPERMRSDEARVMVIAICLQESRLAHRKQLPIRSGAPFGPARGLAQFELGGGVTGVLNHPSTKTIAAKLCREFDVVPAPSSVWNALAEDDVLAACFARLLLWTDPRSLPRIGDAQAAWDCYIRNWRPGKPHRHTWDSLYSTAVETVRASR